jgi:hypothetical protein
MNRRDDLAEARAQKKVSQMQEAELLKFLRASVNDLACAVDRLESLAEQREDNGTGTDSA